MVFVSCSDVATIHQEYDDIAYDKETDGDEEIDSGIFNIHSWSNYDEDERLVLHDIEINDFAFLEGHCHIRALAIMECSLNSFDYIDINFPNLSFLWISNNEVSEGIESIPYIENLRSIIIRCQNAFKLIDRNNHINGSLGVCLNYAHYRDAETVFISLEPIKHFVDITAFEYMGYATELDIYYLQFMSDLEYINIWRDVYSLSNIEYLLNLDSLAYLALPRKYLTDVYRTMFNHIVFEMGS